MDLQLWHFYSWKNLNNEKIFGLLVEKTEKWLHFRLWDQEYNQEWDGWMLVNLELITDFVEIQEIPPQDGNFLPQEFLFGKSFEKFFYKKKMCNVVYRLGDKIFDEFWVLFYKWKYVRFFPIDVNGKYDDNHYLAKIATIASVEYASQYAEHLEEIAANFPSF